MHIYSPLSKEKSLLQCDKYTGTRTVLSNELTLISPTNCALQTNLQSIIPCRNFLLICGQYAYQWLEVPTSSLIVGTQQHLANHSSLKLHVPSPPHHKSCQNNQTPKRHHPQRDKRVNKIWGQISSTLIPSSTGKYPDSTVTNHSVSPSLAPHHKTCIYHSHHKDGNCMSTTTETLQQSAPLLHITIQSVCPSLDLGIFQFHFNVSHYLQTYS